MNKYTTLTFQIETPLKDAPRTAAEKDHRSMTSMVMTLIRDHCKRNKISIKTTLTKRQVKRKKS